MRKKRNAIMGGMNRFFWSACLGIFVGLLLAACQKADEPTPTPAATPTATAAHGLTATPTPTAIPTPTRTPTPSAAAAFTPAPTATPTPQATPTASPTPTPVVTQKGKLRTETYQLPIGKAGAQIQIETQPRGSAGARTSTATEPKGSGGAQITVGEIPPAERKPGQGRVSVEIADADGKAQYDLLVRRYDPSNREWEQVYTKSSAIRDWVNAWKTSFFLAPGLYRLEAHYYETSPVQRREYKDLEIKEGTQVSITDYFDRGQVQVTLEDADGKAQYDLLVRRYDPSNREWEQVYTKSSAIRDWVNAWKTSFFLAPGLYRLEAHYYESTPLQKWDLGQLTVVGGEFFKIDNGGTTAFDTAAIPGVPPPPSGRKLLTSANKNEAEGPYSTYQEFSVKQAWEVAPDDPNLRSLDQYYEARVTANGWQNDTQAIAKTKTDLNRAKLWSPDTDIISYQFYHTQDSGRPEPIYNKGVVSRQLTITYNREAKQLTVGYTERYAPQEEPLKAYAQIKAIIENKTLTDEQRRGQLAEVERSFGAKVFLAAVRLIPVYDANDGAWKSLDDFSKQLLSRMGGDPGGSTRLEKDPIGTVFDMAFGDALSSPEKVCKTLGICFP